MTHTEIKEAFVEKINKTKALIENSVNGDKLEISTSFAYVDNKLIKSDTYNGIGETSILAFLHVYANGKNGDEDPSYENSLLCDISDGVLKSEEELQKEYEAFDEDIQRFIEALEKSENIDALLNEEYERSLEEGKKELAAFEQSLKKMKKIGIFCGVALLGLMILIVIIRSFM